MIIYVLCAVQTNTRFAISQCAPAESRLGSTVPSAHGRPLVGGSVRCDARSEALCLLLAVCVHFLEEPAVEAESRPPSPAWRPRARRRGAIPGRWPAWHRARSPLAHPLSSTTPYMRNTGTPSACSSGLGLGLGLDLALRTRTSSVPPDGSYRTVSRGYVGFTLSAYGMQADTVGGGTAAGAASRRTF